MMKRSFVVAGLLIGVLMFSATSQAELIGFWAFEEGSGTIAADTSGHGKDGTIVNENKGLGAGGSVWVTDAERGSVISFGGTASGAYVKIGADIIPVMNFTIDFTWSFWTKQAAGNADNNIIVGNRMSLDAVDFVPRQFIKFTPTKFEFHTNGNGDDNLDYDNVPNDVWVHHVVVKEGTLFTYYSNGVAGPTHTTAQELVNALPLFFGGDNEGAAGENWTGYLDNVRIYDQALSAQAVAKLYEWEKTGSSDASNWEVLK